jgi:uncharacterized protein
MLLQSFIGGLMIGSAAAILLLGRGQIAGISGVLGNLVEGRSGGWRLPFLLGFLAAPVAVLLAGGGIPGRLELAWPLAIGSGLLVGFGTRLGNGCTSGHGLCGLGNFSTRSLVAVIGFFCTAAITVFVVRHVLAGGH